MTNYLKELPNEYLLDKVIDAKDNTKVKIFFTLGSFLILVIVLAFFLPYLIENFPVDYDKNELYWPLLIFALGSFLYIVLHELTHGLFYKIFTKEKLTFGLTLTVAYCGVPNLYLKKVPAVIAALAPFVIFSVLFGVPLFFIKDYWMFCVMVLLFSSHLSGCVGDIYCSILMIFKYKGKELLVNDTGPKQSFYIKK